MYIVSIFHKEHGIWREARRNVTTRLKMKQMVRALRKQHGAKNVEVNLRVR